jgi:A/G-specific adenine glycosylase
MLIFFTLEKSLRSGTIPMPDNFPERKPASLQYMDQRNRLAANSGKTRPWSLSQIYRKIPDCKRASSSFGRRCIIILERFGYYSRAINLHKAAHQVVEDFGGEFPNHYNDILKLKGVGKYTAAAIASICFDEKIPAVDGNFYRVLSRIFADDFDISSSKAFQYFSDLALLVMPEEKPGEFNQAIMDIGAEICRPKNPLCMFCPVNEDCMAFQTGRVSEFPVKTKKVKVSDLSLKYFFVKYQNQFLIKQRGNDFIWKKLYEFPTSIPENWNGM